MKQHYEISKYCFFSCYLVKVSHCSLKTFCCMHLKCVCPHVQSQMSYETPVLTTVCQTATHLTQICVVPQYTQQICKNVNCII